MENHFYSFNNGKAVISRSKLLLFWNSQGFRKIKMPSGDYNLVQITKNSIIKDAKSEDLMSSVREKLSIDNQPLVWEEFLKGDYISKNNYLAIEELTDLKFNLATKNVSYFFFRNGIVKVTATGFEMLDYQNYEGFVHEDQIIQHDLELGNGRSENQSMFSQFLTNVVNNNEDRLRALRTAIGYSIHSYKDSSLTKAVIFVDEVIDFSGEANGGTGKSLIAKAIQKIAHSVFKDGKSLNNKGNRFFYQDINLFHRVLILDDINNNFDFEDFYSAITGEMSVEEKYKKSYKIPFELSPKLVITSNYMVKGSGGESDQRRRIEIEIYPRYSMNFTPYDEFGVRFFTDWNEQEYNLFYLDMLKNCQLFLAEGIFSIPGINLVENKLKLNTDYSFVEFADSKLLLQNDEDMLNLDKEELYTAYREMYPVETKNISSIKFKKWLDLYCIARGLNIHHYKSNSKNLMRIFKQKKQ